MIETIRELVAAGFVLHDLIEPEWPPNHDKTWGQWSPLRGRLFPGTAIFAATIALRQFDLKKVFAYSTVSQLGFMFVAARRQR